MEASFDSRPADEGGSIADALDGALFDQVTDDVGECRGPQSGDLCELASGKRTATLDQLDGQTAIVDRGTVLINFSGVFHRRICQLISRQNSSVNNSRPLIGRGFLHPAGKLSAVPAFRTNGTFTPGT